MQRCTKDTKPWHHRVTVSLCLDRINVSRCYRLTPGGPVVPSPCAAAASAAMQLPAAPIVYECPEMMQRPRPPPPPGSPRSGFAHGGAAHSTPSAASASEVPRRHIMGVAEGSDAKPVVAKSSGESIGVAKEPSAPTSIVRYWLCNISGVLPVGNNHIHICYFSIGGKVMRVHLSEH